MADIRELRRQWRGGLPRLPRAGQPPSPRLALAAALAMVAAVGTALSFDWTLQVDRLIRAVAGMAPAPAVAVAEAPAPPAALRGGGGGAANAGGRYGLCTHPRQQDCVVDGDTFRDGPRSIRLADIDTPEIFHPQCAAEKQLGERAARRLQELLNGGVIVIAPGPADGPHGGRDEDQYGRKLRVVKRGGKSLGEILAAEGLARRWDGARRSWCN